MEILLFQRNKLFKSIIWIGLFLFAKENASASSPPVFPSYPIIHYQTEVQAQHLKRGEYLVKLGDCISCHTEKKGISIGKSFAGGLPFPTPFGTVYSPNITPDK